MNEAQKEWIEYIERVTITSKYSKSEISKQAMTIEIGLSYGLDKFQMAQISTWI